MSTAGQRRNLQGGRRLSLLAQRICEAAEDAPILMHSARGEKPVRRSCMSARRIVIAGGTGFLGGLLCSYLQPRGWDPIVLTRTPSASATYPEVAWDSRTIGPWAQSLDGAEAVINFTGRSINCRFTDENRRLVMNSRVESTRVLGEAIARCAKPPRTWLNSSTATIYRHTLGPAHDETSSDFAATAKVRDAFSVEVALAWEKALAEAPTPQIRKVALRTTLVFGTVPGGVFQSLRRLSRVGLGGRMGNGRQFVSWIHDVDFVRAVEWLLETQTVEGPVNMAAPNPVTNADMMRVMRHVCGIPIGLPAAEWMLEVGAVIMRTETELLLKSRNVVPGKLVAGGFQFQFPIFESAVADLETRARNPT
jgi:uncharacterized protein